MLCDAGGLLGGAGGEPRDFGNAAPRDFGDSVVALSRGGRDDAGGATDPGRGRRLGVDVGSVRIGVALSDPDGLLASPLCTVRRETSGSDLTELAALVHDHDVVEVVVGLPRTLSGHDGPAAVGARAYADELAERIAPVPVQLSDERLTTVAATRTLASRGVRGRKQRAVIDQAAAVEILRTWLDARSRRTSGASSDGASSDGASSNNGAAG